MHSPGRTPTRLRTIVTASAAGLVAAGGLIAAGTTAREAPAATAVPISVSDADGLREALAGARPGDTIRLADGRYRGSFEITASGTAGSRITLTGSPKAVLTASGGYGLRLNGASYWTVRGITVRGGREGIRIDAARSVTVDSVSVSVRRPGHA
ncbi:MULTISPECIES: hypothetical protein [Streptomyces]|uniref:Uncharacterized protein n=1 Tax=Streptomyces melanosporofaciens TaxID=67327 RepID=A0A1H4LLQ3_STRMJ|nr:hypothetical protein [Streptomyces melanosporofaciens]SEB71643.1 hypothetical protein SAMN04490356_1395 [Streptomyces melanosporofaciens]